MESTSAIQIGILSPATPNRPHFKSLDGILPPGVSIVHEGLGLLGESYQDLVGKTDQVVELAKNFVQRHNVRGLMVTGGFVTLFNPGLEEKVAGAIGLPVASAVSSAVADIDCAVACSSVAALATTLSALLAAAIVPGGKPVEYTKLAARLRMRSATARLAHKKPP